MLGRGRAQDKADTISGIRCFEREGTMNEVCRLYGQRNEQTEACVGGKLCPGEEGNSSRSKARVLLLLSMEKRTRIVPHDSTRLIVRPRSRMFLTGVLQV